MRTCNKIGIGIFSRSRKDCKYDMSIVSEVTSLFGPTSYVIAPWLVGGFGPKQNYLRKKSACHKF